MRDIHCLMNASRFAVVASALLGGAAHDASGVVLEVEEGPVGAAEAVFLAVAIIRVNVDETTSATTRLDLMVPPT
jgi:hypothetical protein